MNDYGLERALIKFLRSFANLAASLIVDLHASNASGKWFNPSPNIYRDWITLSGNPVFNNLTDSSKSKTMFYDPSMHVLMSFALIPLASTIPANTPSKIISTTSWSNMTAYVFSIWESSSKKEYPIWTPKFSKSPSFQLYTPVSIDIWHHY
jgi:hypothetical protein